MAEIISIILLSPATKRAPPPHTPFPALLDAGEALWGGGGGGGGEAGGRGGWE